MSTDVFAHGVYGVRVPDEFLVECQALSDAIEQATGEPYDAVDHLMLSVELQVRLDRLLYRIVSSFGLPGPHGQYGLFYTGADEDRLGRCGVEADAWLLGFGMSEFPDVDYRAAHRLKAAGAEWHTWCT